MNTTSRPVMNPPAQAEAGNRAHTAPRQADPDVPCRVKTGVSSGSEARPVTATETDPHIVPGWDCADGTPDEDHDWEYISDWYGDPEVINGTCDIHYKRCRQCGKEAEWNGERPERDYERE